MLKWQFQSPENENQHTGDSRKKLELFKETYLKKKNEEEEEEDKEYCESCGEQLVSESISAGGHSYHVECFVCSLCGVRIEEEYFIEEGEILCDNHNKEICSACGLAVQTDYLLISEKVLHQSCFVCSNCDQPLVGSYYPQDDGTFFCGPCYSKLLLPECTACGQTITGEIIRVESNSYHRHCYSCKRCGHCLVGERVFTNSDDDILCADCFLFFSNSIAN